MTVTWSPPMLSTIRRTTVVFPDPEPPATPMTSGAAISFEDPGVITVVQAFSHRPQDAGRRLQEYQDIRRPSDKRDAEDHGISVVRAPGAGGPVRAPDRVVGVCPADAQARRGSRGGRRRADDD